MKSTRTDPSAGELSDPNIDESLAPELQSGAIPDLDTLLQQPLLFHRVFLQITGDIAAAWVLNEVYYWTRQRGQWFSCGLERWEAEYGVKRRAFKSAVAQLSRLGLLDIKKEGLPLRLSYRVNLAALCTEIRKVTRALQFVQNAKLDCTKRKTALAETPNSTGVLYSIGSRDGTRDGKDRDVSSLFALRATGADTNESASLCSQQNGTCANQLHDHGAPAPDPTLNAQATGAPSAAQTSLPAPDFGGSALLEAWRDFITFRAEIGKPRTPTSAKVLLEQLQHFGALRARLAIHNSIRKRWPDIYEPEIKGKKTSTPRQRRKPQPKREVFEPGKFSLTQEQIAQLEANGELEDYQRLYDEINDLWAKQVANHAQKGRPMTPITQSAAMEQIQDLVTRRGYQVAIASLRKTIEGGYLRIVEETDSEQLEREATS